MSIESDLLAHIADHLNIPVHYQHLSRRPTGEFAWFIRNGEDYHDDLDPDSSEPDVVYCDLELYADSADRLVDLATLTRSMRDYRGSFGDGPAFIDDIGIEDQRDDYEQQAPADSLPPFSTSFRVVLTGYETSA